VGPNPLTGDARQQPHNRVRIACGAFSALTAVFMPLHELMSLILVD
jgi:hypothetical protein